jgi:hypothetical protein
MVAMVPLATDYFFEFPCFGASRRRFSSLLHPVDFIGRVAKSQGSSQPDSRSEFSFRRAKYRTLCAIQTFLTG